MEITKLIEKAALINAVQHKGKADPKAVLGRVLAEKPELRNKLIKTADEIKIILTRVNRISLEEQTERLRKIFPEFFEEKKVETRKLPPLKNAKKGKVVLRVEPSPTGPMHIGNAFALLLNASYADKYDGKLILRIADTNPAAVYKYAYKLIEDNANWITGSRIDEIHCQSDRLKIYYDYAEKIIRTGRAYVCTCDQSKFKFFLSKKTACPCRNLSSEEQERRWKDMFVRYNEGEAVLRIKTDIKHKNPAMRDFPAFRITTEKHSRQGTKYRVWPLMNFAVAIDDHLMNLTHIIRGKDHMDNTLRQGYIFDAFDWKKPEYIHYGRVQFIGLKLSKREIIDEVRKKKYTGFDDVRLPTLQALRRRGLQPEAFRKYVIDVGPGPVDKNVKFSEFMKIIYSYNKEIVDPIANRYSFVLEPVKISVLHQPKIREINIPVSPYSKKKRKLRIGKDIYIAGEDFNKYRSKEIRLKDLFNIELDKRAKFTSQPKKKIQKIQWVSTGAVKAEVLMLDGSVARGLAESNIKKLKVGDIVQFERFGFCILDEKPARFCFTQK